MKRNLDEKYEKSPFRAILLSMLIIFVCATAFCGCVSATAVSVDNFKDLQNNFTKQVQITISGNIQLDGDISATRVNYTVIKDDVTPNLNGHNITFEEGSKSCFYITKGGNLTVKDSPDKKTGVINLTTDKNTQLFYVDNGTLNLESGTFKANSTVNTNNISLVSIKGSSDKEKSQYSKFILGEDATLITGNNCWAVGMFQSISNTPSEGFGIVADIYGKIESNNFGGITINGQLHPSNNNLTSPNLPNITIHKGAVINTKEAAVYGAGYGIWTFEEECQVTGMEALSIKSGKFTINGGTFTGNGEYVEPAAAYTGGTEDTGAALSITDNKAYARNVEVVINGGKFTSTNGHAVYEGTNSKEGSKSALGDNGITINVGEFITNNNEIYPIYIANLNNQNVKVILNGKTQLYPNFNLSAANWTADGDNLILTLYDDIENLECINLTHIEDDKTARLELNGYSIKSDKKGNLIGWNSTSSTGNVIDVKQTASTVFKEKKAYYPLFGYNVTFNGNGVGEEEKMDNQSFVSGVAQKLNASTFKREGYDFGGWATTVNGAAEYADNQSITITDNTTLYAVWNKVAAPEKNVEVATNASGAIDLNVSKGNVTVYQDKKTVEIDQGPVNITITYKD
ncbi:MAG TPA: InlB B-repeat-containing protein, partial [Methanocorpusculum sp.]|nr:InlB B-repeat-containing protein [Methanocorpusculum sp.]